MSENGSGEHPAVHTEDHVDTLRPEELQQQANVAEQKELTKHLLEDPDPHIRLLAHVSQRQLDLFEMFLEQREEIREIRSMLERQSM